jgi:hypothetical protein
MKIILSVLFALFLTACNSIPTVQQEHVVVKQIEYVVKIPPAELMTLPAPAEKIDIDSASQASVAQWILASEERTRTLENMLKGIATFFVVEQAKAKDSADTKNAAALVEAGATDAAFADKVIKTPVKK